MKHVIRPFTFRHLILFSCATFVATLTTQAFFDIFTDEEPDGPRESRQWGADEVATIERSQFSLVYPAAWTIATDQPDYDPDSNFTIDTTGDSYISIETFPGSADTDYEQILDNLTDAFDGPLVTTYSRSYFTTWGPHEGSGLHLKGKIMNLFPGGCRFFVTVQNGLGVICTEYYFSEDIEQVIPGFELIAQSFQFK